MDKLLNQENSSTRAQCKVPNTLMGQFCYFKGHYEVVKRSKRYFFWSSLDKLWSKTKNMSLAQSKVPNKPRGQLHFKVIWRSFGGQSAIFCKLKVVQGISCKIKKSKPLAHCPKNALWYILRLVIFSTFQPLVDLGWPPNVIYSLLMSSPDDAFIWYATCPYSLKKNSEDSGSHHRSLEVKVRKLVFLS